MTCDIFRFLAFQKNTWVFWVIGKTRWVFGFLWPVPLYKAEILQPLKRERR